MTLRPFGRRDAAFEMADGPAGAPPALDLAPLSRRTEEPRSGVVDLGSNSVRLVIFEGVRRNPVAIFNEKAVLRLGQGLQATGRLNDEAVPQAVMVLRRYAAVARAMRADPFEILATAAVRDASNGPELIELLRAAIPGVSIRVLSGEEEAGFSAEGMLCGIPSADGVLADIGGGSLEVIRLANGARAQAATLPLGVIRLAERAGHDPIRARAIAEEDLAQVPWVAEGLGRDLFLVGGAFRALARVHILQTGYPLNMVHHYTIERDEARDLTGVLAAASRKALERMPGVPRRRMDDLPYAAVVLRRVLRATGARRVIFSANGLREGWYMRRMPAALREQDPMLAAAMELAAGLGRDMALPPALLRWTEPLFPFEGSNARRLREAACWMSDVGSHDHPEYRAEQAYLRVLRQPGSGLDHHARAFLGMTLAVRYEAEPDAPFVQTARVLLGADEVRRATVLGTALRLAYTLCAGTSDLLSDTVLDPHDGPAGTLRLRLAESRGVFAGESVTRRLDRLALAMGLVGVTEAMA